MKRSPKCQKNNLRLVVLRPGIDPHVRKYVRKFYKWLRIRYLFPKKVTVYLYGYKMIRSLDGENAFGTAYFPEDGTAVLIRVAARCSLGSDWRENHRELYGILWSFAHEIGHYFQWLDDPDTDFQSDSEDGADEYAEDILDQYLSGHSPLYPRPKQPHNRRRKARR